MKVLNLVSSIKRLYLEPTIIHSIITSRMHDLTHINEDCKVFSLHILHLNLSLFSNWLIKIEYRYINRHIDVLPRKRDFLLGKFKIEMIENEVFDAIFFRLFNMNKEYWSAMLSASISREKRVKSSPIHHA